MNAVQIFRVFAQIRNQTVSLVLDFSRTKTDSNRINFRQRFSVESHRFRFQCASIIDAMKVALVEDDVMEGVFRGVDCDPRRMEDSYVDVNFSECDVSIATVLYDNNGI